jgi:hypothetical protein
MMKLLKRCAHEYILRDTEFERGMISRDYTSCQCLCRKCMKIRFFTLPGKWDFTDAREILSGKGVIRYEERR